VNSFEFTTTITNGDSFTLEFNIKAHNIYGLTGITYNAKITIYKKKIVRKVGRNIF